MTRRARVDRLSRRSPVCSREELAASLERVVAAVAVELNGFDAAPPEWLFERLREAMAPLTRRRPRGPEVTAMQTRVGAILRDALRPIAEPERSRAVGRCAAAGKNPNRVRS